MNRVRPRTSLWFLPLLAFAAACPGVVVDDAGPRTDAGTGDAGLTDAGLERDGGALDAGHVDDAGSVDAGFVDAGAVDAGAVDAGAVDAGAVDAGPFDAGAVDDAGSVDAGHFDAGPSDAGAPSDAGEVDDAGPSDAGPPHPYWTGIDTGVDGQEFLLALHERLSTTHIELGYEALNDAYLLTDTGRGCGAFIFDVYSSYCWDPDDQCGNYTAEGQCYNREHSWPKSWWGGSETIAPHSDLFAVIPADGYVNNRRGNLPFGHVSSAIYTSTNGSRVGACVELDALGDCFEPIDALKGDFARIYFYMAARYEAELSCCLRAAVDGADLNPWEENLLRAWHALDPVDDDERARNDAVFVLQGNRNPFVDEPSWVMRISDY